MCYKMFRPINCIFVRFKLNHNDRQSVTGLKLKYTTGLEGFKSKGSYFRLNCTNLHSDVYCSFNKNKAGKFLFLCVHPRRWRSRPTVPPVSTTY